VKVALAAAFWHLVAYSLKLLPKNGHFQLDVIFNFAHLRHSEPRLVPFLIA
jgi:hypothetical protein